MRGKVVITDGLVGRLVCGAELIRLDSCLTAAAYTLIGAYLGNGLDAVLATSVMGTAFLVAITVGFAFAINDYQDAFVDSFGKPDRPIPSGRISRSKARSIALRLAAAAAVLAAMLGAEIFCLALASIVLSHAYSCKLKNTFLLGNATVALLNSAIPIYGGLAAQNLNSAVWIAAVLTFFYIFAQEILYCIEDEEGDRLAGLRTTATQLGKVHALHLFQAAAGVFVLAALTPWFLNLAQNEYLYAVLSCTILPLLAIVIQLAYRPTARAMHLAVYGTWYVWFSSLLPIFLLR